MPKETPSQSHGVAGGHFWRNVTLIAVAHVAVLLGLIRWSVEARNSSDAQSIVWISGAEDLVAAGEPNSSASSQPAMTPIAPPEPEPLKPDETKEEAPLVTVAKSEIELPTPTSTPTPRPTATPTPKPKETPEPTPKLKSKPKPTLKKATLAKASPKPSPKPKSSQTKSAKKNEPSTASAEKKKIAKPAPAKDESSPQAGSGKTSPDRSGQSAVAGGSSESEFGWYGNMLHDRFYSAWVQPTTNVPTGSRISTLVKVRIEKDGRVSKFEIIKPSENVVVNESVVTTAKRVTHVDPPPAGLGNGDHYDVKINFELNTDQGTAK
jgi:TonB family protein